MIRAIYFALIIAVVFGSGAMKPPAKLGATGNQLCIDWDHENKKVIYTPCPPPTQYYSDGTEKPPEQFDHAPALRWVVLHVNQDDIGKFCGPRTDACTKPIVFSTNGDFCLTLVQNKYRDGSNPEFILRHERAHCNGWSHAQ